MKIYITVDMEGITGIAKPSDVLPDMRGYPQGQELMIGDINAAIEGVLDGGAEEVLINDAHDGSWTNFPLSELHDSAHLVHGEIKNRGQMESLTSDHDVVLFVGYHAMAGTAGAVLNHTYRTTSVYRLRANGEEVGEMGFNAKLAASLGVPVGLVTGDDHTVAEALDQIGNLESVAVKEGIGRFSANCRPPSETRPEIREAAKRTVERAAAGDFQQSPPDEPSSVEVDWKTTNEAHHAAQISGAEWIDDRTTRIEADTFPAAYERGLSMIRAGIVGRSDTLF